MINMNCQNHPDREAVAACSVCGKVICEECRLKIANKNYCQDCADALITTATEKDETVAKQEEIPEKEEAIPEEEITVSLKDGLSEPENYDISEEEFYNDYQGDVEKINPEDLEEDYYYEEDDEYELSDEYTEDIEPTESLEESITKIQNLRRHAASNEDNIYVDKYIEPEIVPEEEYYNPDHAEVYYEDEYIDDVDYQEESPRKFNLLGGLDYKISRNKQEVEPNIYKKEPEKSSTMETILETLVGSILGLVILVVIYIILSSI